MALLVGKYFGVTALDPLMGLVGAALVSHWSWGLLRDSGRVLLDHQAPAPVQARLREAIEQADDARVVDLHVWSIGPGVNAACLTIVSGHPRPAADYRARLPASLRLAHVTIEVHACPEHAGAVSAA